VRSKRLEPRSGGTSTLDSLAGRGWRLSERAVVAVGLTAGIGAFILYVLTLDPAVAPGDSGELIAAASVLGVAHAPGYPLYILLGHVALLVPIGSPAARMNCLSAILDASAVSVVYFVILRLVRGGRAADRNVESVTAALVGALLLGFSTLFWAYSVVAEVFALNNLLAAAIILVGLGWLREPSQTRRGALLFFLFGLALSDQETIVLFAPALAVTVLCVVVNRRRSQPGWRPRPRTVLLGFTAFTAGMLPYLYMPLAASSDPPVDWGYPTSVGRFLDDLLRRSYGTMSFSPAAGHGSVLEQLQLLSGDLVRGFVWIGGGLALAGLIWAWRYRRGPALVLITAFVISGPVFVVYGDPSLADPTTKSVLARFYILPSIPLAILAGAGSWWLLPAARQLVVRVVSPRLAIVPMALLLSAPVAAAAVHYGDDDQRGDVVASHFADDLLTPLPRDAVLLYDGQEYWESLLYAQLVAHVRPDIIAIDVTELPQRDYVSLLRKEHPTLRILLGSYDSGDELNSLVSDNLRKRAVYYTGSIPSETFGTRFEWIHEGLAERLVEAGTVRNPYAVVVRHASQLEALRYPLDNPPPTSLASVITQHYGAAAFWLGFALAADGGRTSIPEAEKMYISAIVLDPTFADSYLDLGSLLLRAKAPPTEIAAILGRYLQLDPGAPQREKIRAFLRRVAATLARQPRAH
jgi:hypothetical protein